MENTSEFFDTPSGEALASSGSREIIGDSESGYSQLWRLDRGGRFRVLKCLKPEYRENPLYERLLLKEFDIGYSLSHGNICEYYSFFRDPELGNCIEMEWVDGRTLEVFLAEGRRERSVYDKVIGEICSALAYMHAKQVLHRDLKPSNILVTFNGDNVKLIDFGLSDTDSSSILKNPAGTAVFAAPEVRSGGKASVRSDLYSLGMVMSLFPVRKYSGIVRKLCSVDAGNRYASVLEVQKALKSDGPAVAGIIFILLVAAVALVPVITRWLSLYNHTPSLIPGLTENPDSFFIQQSEDNDVILNEVKNLPDTAAQAPKDTLSQEVPLPANPDNQPSSVCKDGKGAKDTKDHKAAKDSKATDATLIDELFRQATELFE